MKKNLIKILKHINNPDSEYYFTPQESVNWFDFLKLKDTFMNVIDSEKMLGMIDKREVENAYAKDSKFCYIDKEELWLDFMADTGDGFNSTTSVFYAITREELLLKDKVGIDTRLKRGDILTIGGDLVYPDASEIQYINRFKGPLRFVFPNTNTLDEKKSHPHLYAIPGNHDWYDGLSAFTRMMCQQKKIGGYKTNQNRSYFSLELRENLLFFGIDNQLKGDLDIPQIEYFKNIVKDKIILNKRLHIILNVAEPSWYEYWLRDTGRRPQRFDSVNYFMKELKKEYENIKFDIIVTGDIHHYAHYENNSNKNEEDVDHLITSGGGGAFKHVTSFLDRKEYIDLPNINNDTSNNYKLDKDSKYPSSKFSEKHILKNLLFPFANREFTFYMMILVAVNTFVFYLFTNFQGYSILVNDSHTWVDIFKNMLHVIISYTLSLLPILLPGIVIFGIIHAVQPKEINQYKLNKFKLLKWLTFILAVVLQNLLFVSIIVVYYKSLHFNPNLQNISQIYTSNNGCCVFWKALSFVVVNSMLSGILLSTLYGIFLMISYRFWNFSITEASSSNIIEGYNNFLRFKITNDKVHIYVIKVQKAYNWYKYIRSKFVSDKPDDATDAQSYVYANRNNPLVFLDKIFKTNAKEDIQIVDEIIVNI